MSETIEIGKKKLIISSERIQLLDGVLDQVLLNPTQFRFGIRPIEFEPMTFGSTYMIQVKDALDRSISIEWNSIFNLKRKKIISSYEYVLEKLWHNFFRENLKEYEKTIEEGNVVTLGNFELSKDRIKKIAEKPEDEITIDMNVAMVIRKWDKLRIKSMIDPDERIYIDTLEEWNSPFIYALLDKIKGE